MRGMTYAVFNHSDGIFASPDRFGSRRAAQQFARDFRKRYAQQGYYLTSNRERIPVKEVELVIIEMFD